MATWAVVPVKHFKVGKSRLATVLSDRARAGLSVRLLKRTMDLLARSAVIHHTLVISCDDSALQLAREQGAFTVNDSSLADLNGALQKATHVAVSLGATSLLVLPSDLPLLEENDLEVLAGVNGSEPCVVLAPDRHGTGTNALFVCPPGLLRYQFGAGSLAAHQQQARSQGAKVSIHQLPRVEFDVDEPADLHRLQSIMAEFRDEEI